MYRIISEFAERKAGESNMRIKINKSVQQNIEQQNHKAPNTTRKLERSSIKSFRINEQPTKQTSTFQNNN